MFSKDLAFATIQMFSGIWFHVFNCRSFAFDKK